MSGAGGVGGGGQGTATGTETGGAAQPVSASGSITSTLTQRGDSFIGDPFTFDKRLLVAFLGCFTKSPGLFLESFIFALDPGLLLQGTVVEPAHARERSGEDGDHDDRAQHQESTFFHHLIPSCSRLKWFPSGLLKSPPHLASG